MLPAGEIKCSTVLKQLERFIILNLDGENQQTHNDFETFCLVIDFYFISVYLS